MDTHLMDITKRNSKDYPSNNKQKRTFLGHTLVFLLYMSFSGANLAQPVSIPRSSDKPVIDGRIDKDEWRSANQVKLTTETFPDENVDAPVSTEVFLMEDGETLYVAFIAHEPDVEKIRAYYQDHDKTNGHDLVGIVLDTFNDERQAFEFFANPLGVQRDAINDDVNRRYNQAWDGLWKSAGKINGTNYSVEMAIPLSQLRFASKGGLQTWGLDLVRLYPRDKNRRFSHVPQDRNIACYLCQIGKAEGFNNLSPSLNLTLIPTITANTSEVREDPLVDDWEKEDSETEVGLDVRWGINQNTYLNATINPDFSQVEADNPQLSVNSTFSLFFEERRTFFLDGSDYFNSRLNIVHTRNIADPDYGAKITGKDGPHTYGVLTARDTVTNFIIPGNQGSNVASLDEADGSTESDITVARYRYDLSEDHTLGVIMTDRRGDDYSNTVTGIDGNFKFTDSDRVEFQALQSSSEYPLAIQVDEEQDAELDDHAFAFQYNHRDRKWNWFARYDDYGKDFRADMGFFTRSDFTKLEFGGRHTWYLDDFIFGRLFIGGNWDHSHDQDGNELEEEWEGFVSFQDGPKQSFFEFGGGIRERFFEGQFYDENFHFIVGGFRPIPDMRIFFLRDAGEVVDFANNRLGESEFYRTEISYQIGRHMFTELEYINQQFDVDLGELFSASITDLRMTYQFNNNSFLRLTAQYSDVDRNTQFYNDPDDFDQTNKDIATQLLYSYKINALSRFFLGYSDAGFQDDDLTKIEKTNRNFFLKFSYAWQ